MPLRKIPPGLLIAILAAILFIPFLGATHLFDWDEINFAEASREMLLTKNYAIPQINFQPFWEKPPLFFWFQVLSMKMFGVNEFAARFPNAVCGIVTLVLLFRIGSRFVDARFGVIWAFVYAASLLPQLYFKSGIIDPWFNLFIFLSIYHLSQYTDAIVHTRVKHIILAGFFAGLAMMTKGPVALLIIGLCYAVYAVLTRFRRFMKPLHILLFLLLAALVGSIWFIALWMNGQEQIIKEFIIYQVRLFRTEDAGHGGPFFYHFIVLLVGCFPAAALSILSMRKLGRNDYEVPKHFHRWMLILFWVTLILFSIVKTKIVHYSSLCYFPLTFLAAVTFYFLYKRKWNLPVWNKVLQVVTGLVLSLLIIVVTFIDQLKPWLLEPGRIKDQFARANLQANVHWTGFEKLAGLILLSGVVYFLFNSAKVIRRSLVILFLASLVAVNLTILLVTPKVEPYSQGAAIEFYQSKENENAVIETVGFKSYANLFYAKRPAKLGKPVADSILQYNVHPEVSVYYVGKIQNKQQNMDENNKLKELYKKNGFVFYQYQR
jgi:4-amino-4-deoxy-L-arabinose transferase-like glycosyltransferase